MKDHDLIVIGAGNAMDILRMGGEGGLDVAVVEKGPLGGTCPNRGCIPSKLLLAHADLAHALRTSGKFHIDAHIESIDGARILGDTRDYINRFDDLLSDGLPATLYRGHGGFVDNHTVEVNGQRLHARKIVIATGSRPRHIDLGVPYLTSDEVFQLEHLPQSITIVGGGFIAAELAHFFSGVGVKTTMLVRGDKLLEAEDEQVRAIFQEAFVDRVDVRFRTELVKAEPGYRLALSTGDTLESEALLLAIGRVPNSDHLDLGNTDVAVDRRGFVTVDGHLRTNVEGVYAMGDVTGRYAFTHAASFEAKYLAAQILGHTQQPIDYGPMPHAVFTKPEIAGVGATEQQLRADGVEYVKGEITYQGATKGRAIKEEHGLVKFLLDPDGKILGCHIVGADASILLHEVLPVMKWRNHISSITGLIHVHPSLPELVRGAARNAESALGGS